MTEFGQLLRKFRHRCNSSTSPHGKLTQEKFGELVGAKLGISYTGAAVSDWERGKSKIHADDRALLMALIEVLYDHGGIKTAAEANQLLKARNARDLVPEELTRIFNEGIPDSGGGSADSEQKATKPLIFSIMRRVLSIPEDQLPGLMAKAREGPPPSWPRVVVAFIRQFSDQLSVFHVLKSVLWIWVWLLTWALIAPSLRWPFPDQDNALLAITAYAFGSLLIPALIGALTNTKDNKFWQQQ